MIRISLPKKLFTFHNVSINPGQRAGTLSGGEQHFTFHNVSINPQWLAGTQNKCTTLHSTMFLLIPRTLHLPIYKVYFITICRTRHLQFFIHKFSALFKHKSSIFLINKCFVNLSDFFHIAGRQS